MSNIITFYDIASKRPNFCYSPNTSKIRYTLNYKGLAFETVWVEFSDIQPLCERIGAAPTTKKPDGSPKYTLPVIQDPSTGAVVSDSILIAEYLDATYPNTLRVIPAGTNALQHAFLVASAPAVNGLNPFYPASLSILNPPSVEFFRRRREALMAGKLPQETLPKEVIFEANWKKLVDGFGAVDGFMAAGKLEGPFVMGNTISFADFVIGGYISWMKKIWGEDSSEWKNFKVLHGGRWDVLITALEKYDV